jgi:hypothetical protein
MADPGLSVPGRGVGYDTFTTRAADICTIHIDITTILLGAITHLHKRCKMQGTEYNKGTHQREHKVKSDVLHN